MANSEFDQLQLLILEALEIASTWRNQSIVLTNKPNLKFARIASKFKRKISQKTVKL